MEENSITIKKSDLWKYSTFVLVAVVLLGSVFMFTGSGSVNSKAVNNGEANGGTIDMDVFLDNPNLYPSIGPDDAENVVIELSDFQCSHCGIASGIPLWASQQYSSQPHYDSARKTKELAKNGEIRFIYVPLSFLGAESVYTAQAGLCANQQGKFWEMHDAIFEASTTPKGNDGKYSKENLKKIAFGISGLDLKEFNECLDSDETVSDVQRATANVQSLGISIGTPQFFVNGKSVPALWGEIQAALV
jgi:protein-disulfide isomerase